jgi:hypothetical protein
VRSSSVGRNWAASLHSNRRTDQNLARLVRVLDASSTPPPRHLTKSIAPLGSENILDRLSESQSFEIQLMACLKEERSTSSEGQSGQSVPLPWHLSTSWRICRFWRGLCRVGFASSARQTLRTVRARDGYEGRIYHLKG